WDRVTTSHQLLHRGEGDTTSCRAACDADILGSLLIDLVGDQVRDDRDNGACGALWRQRVDRHDHGGAGVSGPACVTDPLEDAGLHNISTPVDTGHVLSRWVRRF